VGQKQLLAFARALAYDPKILVLDEATSSIDTETEMLIRDALEKLMADRTSIIIAHRLSTVQNADRIIVLHHGRIRETGTHQELLHLKGIYWKLYQFTVQGPALYPFFAKCAVANLKGSLHKKCLPFQRPMRVP
jgi:ATP-binding cassette subfamily B protein